MDSPLQSKNMNGRGAEFYFPDEIAIEILSRVPAKDVVRFRSVCKRWRDLTSSRLFTDLHLQHSAPMVVCQVKSFCVHNLLRGIAPFFSLNHYLIDPWCEPKPQSYKFGEFSEVKILLCNGGLVAMKDMMSDIYMIMNPMYHENVQIRFAEALRIGDLCGVFFHPLLKEYCTLWNISAVSEGVTWRDVNEYKILNLGSKPCWRVINNPWSHLARVGRILPILIGEHLYWVASSKSNSSLDIMEDIDNDDEFVFYPDIMEFDIRKEEFTFISFPAPGPYKCSADDINLLNIGDRLSLVRTFRFEDPPVKEPFQVSIWTLKDRAKQIWTFSSYSIDAPYLLYRRPMAMVNDELLFTYGNITYTCNLKLRDVRYSNLKIDGNGNRHCAYFSTTHVLGLASLRNCKSNIYMDERGEV